MIEGILNNQESSNQSLMFIRDIICTDEQIRKDKNVFYNKEENDDRELDSLKERTLNKLPQANKFQLTVMK